MPFLTTDLWLQCEALPHRPECCLDEAFSSKWLEHWLYNNLIADLFKYACNAVSQVVMSVVNKASILAEKDVVVGVLFTTNTILGYVSSRNRVT